MHRFLLMVTLLLAPGVALASGDGGMPTQKIIFHAINLLILIGGLYYFAGGPIRDALKGRAGSVRTDLDQAQKAQAEAKARYEEIEARLGSLATQVEEMKHKAAADAEAEARDIDARATRDVALIGEAAERSIRNETERARQLLRREAAELAVDLAGQQLKSRIGAAENAQLTRQFIHAVEADNG